MIKKLRKDFIITNMIIVTIITILVFSFVFCTSFKRMYDDTFVFLDSYHQMSHDKKLPDKRGAPDDSFREFGTITVDENGDILQIESTLKNNLDVYVSQDKTSQFTFTEDVVSEYIFQIISSNDYKGILFSHKIAYQYHLNSDASYSIHIAYIGRDLSFLFNLLVTLIIVELATLALFFIVSLSLSKKIIKPVKLAWDKQKQFISDASHELKTPLTVVLANTSILLNKEDLSSNESKKWIGYINDEALRMKTLVDDLLFLAKTDESKNELLKINTNISDLLLEKSLMFEPIAFEKNIKFETEIDDDIVLICDENQIKQLVLIFLDNAFKYCNQDGRVHLALYKSNNQVCIEFSNTGTPIAPESIDSIFDRFYRVDKARTRNSNSHGLGLSIANSIALLHNAKIKVSSIKNDDGMDKGTTTFKIVFASKN